MVGDDGEGVDDKLVAALWLIVGPWRCVGVGPAGSRTGNARVSEVGSAWWYPGPERARSAPRVARARARSARLTV